MEKMLLEQMPYDKRFTLEDGTEALCHATGFEVLIDYDDPLIRPMWMNEYIGPDGKYYYGN